MISDSIERDGLKAGDVVVVTGGGGGFGRAFCRRFAAGGARVAVWDVDRAAAETTVADVVRSGGEARLFEADLANPGDIDRAIDATRAELGDPYCLINNASIYLRAATLDMPLDTWERTFKVNITASWLLAKTFAPAMIAARRGVIINISSDRALAGTPNGAHYAATKAAILSLTKTLALEWAQHNVRCNAIVPGVSMTAQPLAATTPEELVARGKARVPLGRIGYPEDMAGLAWFLASSDAAYMTGQGVAMNGGATMVP